MKKRLLTLGVLAITIMADAQQTAVYVGDRAKLFVGSKALVYSGGNVKVQPAEYGYNNPGGSNIPAYSISFSGDRDIPVINNGMVRIVGDYLKGIQNDLSEENSPYSYLGVRNKYNGAKDYGQLIVSGAKKEKAERGIVMVDKPYTSVEEATKVDEKIDFYPIALPFEMSVLEFLYGLTGFYNTVNETKGIWNNKRYESQLMDWDNSKLVYHHKKVDGNINAGVSYSMNLRDDLKGDAGIWGWSTTDIPSNIRRINSVFRNPKVSYLGTIAPKEYRNTAKGVIRGVAEQEFSNLTYNQWKNRRNEYNELYKSYIGDVDSENRLLNKNQFRYGNPFTSNIDLSAVEGNQAWVFIKNKGLNLNIKNATSGVYIKNFTVKKPSLTTFSVGWDKNVGSVQKEYTYYTAVYNGTEWTGNAEALLIRPLETFTYYFPSLDPSKLGSRIVETELVLNDHHKTFEHTPSAAKTQTSSSLSKMAKTAKTTTGASVKTNANDFYQLEIALVKDEMLEAAPVYLVGTNYNEETGRESKSAAKIFVYGIKDNEIYVDSKKEMNDFNSLSYIAKPLGLGLYKLEEGETYELKFNLYDTSIFNKVKDLDGGVFYIKDKETNKVTAISADTTVRFTAGDNLGERFVLYWKQLPEGEKVSDVIELPKSVETASVQQSTVIYKEGLTNKVRFENNLGNAKVQVYDLAGRLIHTSLSISTTEDYTLSLGAKGVYVVKVTYDNNEVRTLKVVN